MKSDGFGAMTSEKKTELEKEIREGCAGRSVGKIAGTRRQTEVRFLPTCASGGSPPRVKTEWTIWKAWS
jgi:hypothetical protein